MFIFGPSKKKRKFVKEQADSLAIYMKNNAVKSGGEAYARLQLQGVLPKEINKEILWMFWVSVFAFRVSKDLGPVQKEYGNELYEDVYWEMCQIDNKHFSQIPHKPFKEVFSYVGMASDLIYHSDIDEPIKQAGAFFLTISEELPITLSQEQRFTITKELWDAVNSFPSLKEIIKEKA
jgi:hypothetical protein